MQKIILALSLVMLLLIACSGDDNQILAVTPIAQVDVMTTRVVEQSIPTIRPPNGDPAVIPTHVIPVELNLPVMSTLPRGQARDTAYEQDIKMVQEGIDLAVTEPVKLTFAEFYNPRTPENNFQLELSEYLHSLDGKQVTIDGYMAPPLKIGLDWYMLNRIPQASCAFCSGQSDWVEDAILVYYYGNEYPYTFNPLSITGELHVGPIVDIQTGMVSMVRIYPEYKDMIEITYE